MYIYTYITLHYSHSMYMYVDIGIYSPLHRSPVKEVSRWSAQLPLKKAGKSKPLHQSFLLFSKQPPTDKKAGNRKVLVFSQFWVVAWNVHGAQMSAYRGRGCHPMMYCVFLPQHKPNEVSQRSAQFPLKKAYPSKPLHQSFRLFGKQPTARKKGL